MWSITGIKARCAAKADQLLASGEATQAAIDAVWPGGELNDTETGLGAWVVCFGHLVAMIQIAAGEAKQRTPGAVADDPRLDAVLEAARLDAPVPLTLEDGTLCAVHAKSYHTLRWLDALDAQLQHVLVQAAAYPDDVRVQALAPLLESRHVREWVWVLTHPGCGLPYAEHDAAAEPPAFTLRLTGGDLLRLWRAHAEINGEHCRLIASAFPPPSGKPSTGPAPRGLSLGSFLGAMAHEWGLQVSHVARRWSIRELFAQAVDAARSAEAARVRAEHAAAERDRQHPARSPVTPAVTRA